MRHAGLGLGLRTRRGLLESLDGLLDEKYDDAALDRLEEEGLLRSYWAEQAGRRRRLYELTAKGASALADLQGEWRRFSTGVQAVVGGTA